MMSTQTYVLGWPLLFSRCRVLFVPCSSARNLTQVAYIPDRRATPEAYLVCEVWVIGGL